MVRGKEVKKGRRKGSKERGEERKLWSVIKAR